MVSKLLLFLSGIYTLAITWLSLVQLGKISIGEFNPTDKMLHAGAYFLLVLLWKFYFVFKSPDFKRYRVNLYWVAGLSLVFGMLIEVLQGTLTSYRDPDWWDILANSTGVILAVLLFIFLAPTVKSLKQKVD